MHLSPFPHILLETDMAFAPNDSWDREIKNEKDPLLGGSLSVELFTSRSRYSSTDSFSEVCLSPSCFAHFLLGKRKQTTTERPYINHIITITSLIMDETVVNTDAVSAAMDDDHSTASSEGSQTTDELKDSSKSGSTAESNASSSANDEAAKFVNKETRRVFCLRVLVLMILFAASAAISLVVFFVTSAGEDDSFEGEFYAAADKVTGKLEGESPCRVVDRKEFLRRSHAKCAFLSQRHFWALSKTNSRPKEVSSWP